MNRLNILSLSAIAALGLALLPTGAVAQQKTLKEQLVGVWGLVTSDTIPPNGAKRQDVGANPKGIMILDAGGRYAVVQGKPDRPKFKPGANLRLDTPAAEYGEAARGFAANLGSWSVNEADKSLVRKYEIALIPNNDNLESKAAVNLSGDDLKLVTVSPAGVRSETVYRRAK